MATGNLFEFHITVETPTEDSISRLQSLVDTYNQAEPNKPLKVSVIKLANGDNPLQVMVSGQMGNLPHYHLENWATNVTRFLKWLGFKIIRSKDEGVMGSYSTEALSVLYYEHHIKVLLDSEKDVEELKKWASQYEGKVSSNARRVRPDGKQERFITQRSYGSGVEADEMFSTFKAATELKYTILEQEKESVFRDSNFELDKGW